MDTITYEAYGKPYFPCKLLQTIWTILDEAMHYPVPLLRIITLTSIIIITSWCSTNQWQPHVNPCNKPTFMYINIYGRTQHSAINNRKGKEKERMMIKRRRKQTKA